MFKYSWQFIKYDKAKSIGVLIGIVISTFLIGQQSGVYLFLTGLMSTIVDQAHADIWVVDSKTTNANALGAIDIRNLYEVQSIPGVQAAYPMVIAVGNAVFDNGATAGVQLIGSEAPSFRAGPDPAKIVSGKLQDLIQDGAISCDVFDEKTLGNIHLGSAFEINGKRAFVAVETKGIRGFGFTYLYTTIQQARYFGNFPDDKISAVLVDVKPGADVQRICATINQNLYGVRAWPSSSLSRATVAFILGTSGIGISTFTLIIFAIVSGFFIIGLTLYSATLDRIRDYGTLKAIGARNSDIIRLILSQGIVFGISGFLIGMALLTGFKQGLAKQGVLFRFSTSLILLFLCVTLLIAIGGTYFAIRRIVKLEPGSVFKS